MVTFSMPLRLRPQVNARDHWSAVNRRAHQQKLTTWVHGLSALRRGPQVRPPYQVEIVRIGPRHMDDDNVIGSAKHVRDTVAKLLGVDDGDEKRIRFTYAEERGPFGVRVTISGAA